MAEIVRRRPEGHTNRRVEADEPPACPSGGCARTAQEAMSRLLEAGTSYRAKDVEVARIRPLA